MKRTFAAQFHDGCLVVGSSSLKHAIYFNTVLTWAVQCHLSILSPT